MNFRHCAMLPAEHLPLKFEEKFAKLYEKQ